MFHGTSGDNILSIIESGVMRPGSGKVQFAEGGPASTFMHGADRRRGAAFSIEVDVGVPQAAEILRESTQGVRRTLTVNTGESLTVNVKRRFVRTPDGQGGFEHEVIEGTENILQYLRGGQ